MRLRAHEFDAKELERKDDSAQTTAKFRQDAAAAKIFYSAYESAADAPPLQHAAVVGEIADELVRLQSSLLKIGRRLTGVGLSEKGRRLTAAAAMCSAEAESLLRKPTETYPSIRGDTTFLARRSKELVGERTADENDLLRFFVRSVVLDMKRHFGKILYGTVARLANVAFGWTDVTARDVKRIETGR